MPTLQPLFSGSTGNSTLLESTQGLILIDAGVSGKRIIHALDTLGKDIEDIKAIFVTHEHTDHIMSVGSLSRKYGIPIYANMGTWKAMLPYIGDIPSDFVHIFETGKVFQIGEIKARAFLLPHDAAEPVGYTFLADRQKLTLATDIGQMDEKLFLALSGSGAVLLEANYDVIMLEKGRYPYMLKKRIKGSNGHLSNKEAAAVCARLACLGTKNIILGHLSKENNTPELAYDAAKYYIEQCGMRVGKDIQLSIAEAECV